jgi:hypothetical protein
VGFETVAGFSGALDLVLNLASAGVEMGSPFGKHSAEVGSLHRVRGTAEPRRLLADSASAGVERWWIRAAAPYGHYWVH